MKQLSIFIITILLLNSCKKDNADIHGTVTKTGSAQPFSNVMVYLEESHPGFGGTSNKAIDSAITDANGKYLIDFRKNKRNIWGRYGYAVYCNPIGINIDSYKTSTRVSVTSRDVTQDFSINPIAYIRFHLMKTSSSSNYVGIRFENKTSMSDGRLIDHPYPFDTILPAIALPGSVPLDQFGWGIYNGTSISGIYEHFETLYINSGDTLIYPITYY